MELLADPALRPFAVAAVALVALVAIEAASLLMGGSSSGALDLAAEAGAPSGALGWANPGGAPLLVLLIILLATFAAAGFALQGAAGAVAGYLPWWAASLAALAAALPATRLLSRAAARIAPRDETAAVAPAALVGRVGEVTLGPLDEGPPGRVRVRDAHGNVHFVRARAARGAEPSPQGGPVLLVSLEGGVYEAIPAGPELTG